MFGFKILLPFLGTVEIHLPQDIADLIIQHGAGVSVTVHAQGPGGVDKLFLEPSTVQSSYLPIDSISRNFSELPDTVKNLAHELGFL